MNPPYAYVTCHPPTGRRDGHAPRGVLERVRIWIIAHPLAVLLLVATVAGGAITLVYGTDSTVTTQSTDPPVQYLAGDDAGPSTLSDYVTAYSFSTNKTSFTATVKGVPEATLTVGSFFKLDNLDDASKSVTLSTAQVSNTKITAYAIKVFNAGGTLQATLDLKASSPSAAFTIPAHGNAGEPFYATLELTLASGTTDADLGGGLSNDISLSVS